MNILGMWLVLISKFKFIHFNRIQGRAAQIHINNESETSKQDQGKRMKQYKN